MGLIIKGSIQTGNVVTKVDPPPKKEVNTFAELIKKAQQKPSQQPVKLVRETPVESNSPDSSNFIKPKYVEDKSISYKTSSYLKELLGEG